MSYLIELTSQDTTLQEAGFEVCLAISTLDLPLAIIVNDAELFQQCQSLSDFNCAKVFHSAQLSTSAYHTLKKQAKFFLEF